ncbi:hypothetical protein L0B53_05160 [Vibrio sp. SS-MA-C1-2]|uniref:hypothetical protein n=1 Tax=Vibrio sp. SS-MA-C1-2 TaxID=2908646 RepID=UPI001F3525D5|nr:hypothetical protein [Vibrio sp. SS-MA-C1-2]UJF18992.1 hypothetical protein L0B53_05160 [Vibrio sp. SS-MA-C1-2]
MKITYLIPLCLLIAMTGCRDSSSYGYYPPHIPPDPGGEGKLTLEGIDSNKNGFRDDVEREAYRLFPNDPDKQEAINLMAFVDTQIMLVGNSKNYNKTYQITTLLSHASFCFDKRIFNFKNIKVNNMDYIDFSNHIEKINYNTYQRRKALDEFGELVHGLQIGHIAKENACDIIKQSIHY